jgi:hypothetical protein
MVTILTGPDRTRTVAISLSFEPYSVVQEALDSGTLSYDM